MKRAITIGEVIGIVIILAGGFFAFWKNTDVRLTALEIRVAKQEQISDKILEKLDVLQESVNDVKVTLQNKEDRN
jgi:hypothetical protein